MRLKGTLLHWNNDKAFGFITPNSGGAIPRTRDTGIATKLYSSNVSTGIFGTQYGDLYDICA